MAFLSSLPHITSGFLSSECCTSRGMYIQQRGICWKSLQPASSPAHPKSGPPAGNASSRASFLHWPLVSLEGAFSGCAYNSRGHTHSVSAECSVLCFLKTFLSYQKSVLGLPSSPLCLFLPLWWSCFLPKIIWSSISRGFPHELTSSALRFLSPAPLLLYYLLETTFYITVLTCMTELPLAVPAHPSVLTYPQRCPPHLPDGAEGQRREHNWNNPLDLLHSLFNIHSEAMDNFGHPPDHALCISPDHIPWELLSGRRRVTHISCLCQHFVTSYPGVERSRQNRIFEIIRDVWQWAQTFLWQMN